MCYINLLKPVKLKWYLVDININERYVCKLLPRIKVKDYFLVSGG